MKTTELYLEQVLIGFLIIAILALPWAPDLWLLLKTAGAGGDKLLKLIGASAAALGLAFWLGIPFDRLADTLCDRLDRRNRLDFVLKQDKKKNQEKEPSDPYPEDKYLTVLRLTGSVATETQDYLRARIRLSRALAVFGPALTLIATLSVSVIGWRFGGKVGPTQVGIWLGSLAIAYLVWMFLVLFVSEDEELPHTGDHGKFEEYASGRHKNGKLKGELSAWDAEWQTCLVPASLIAAAVVVGLTDIARPQILMTALAGAALTILSAWSWWRISTTHRNFLLDCWTFRDHTKPAEKSPTSTTSSDKESREESHGATEQSPDTRGRDADPSVYEPGDAARNRPAGA